MPRLSTYRFARLCGKTRQLLTLCVLILLLAGVPQVSEAAIYSCATANGIVFQDRPCRIFSAKKATTPKQHRQPLDIDESWFELPGQADERAYCDRRRCECGELQRKLDGSLDQVVADALYMDGNWHRYETSFQLWSDAPAHSARTTLLQEQMREDACRVMISQQLLRQYADEVTGNLRKKALIAEARGFDQPEPCNAGISQACNYLDAVVLLRRMLADAQALKIPRDAFAKGVELPQDR